MRQHTSNAVRTWLQTLGLSAERVEFRMLRGALTIHNIKGDVQGGKLTINSLFIKGNPTSINTVTPQLRQIRVEGLSYDTTQLLPDWQMHLSTIPPSLQHLFYAVQDISLQQADITQAFGFSQLHIHQIHVSGEPTQRIMTGDGDAGDDHEKWSLTSSIPKDTSLQTGTWLSSFEDTQRQVTWSGSIMHNNLIADISQQQNNTSLSIHLNKQTQGWHVDFHAQDWFLQLHDFQTTLSGRGSYSGDSFPNFQADMKGGRWESDKLTFKDTTIYQPEIYIAKTIAKDVSLQTKNQQLHIAQSTVEDAIFDVDTDKEINLKTPWHINIANIDIKSMESAVLHHHEQVNLPILNGFAKVRDSQLVFDVSGTGQDKAFVHIKSKQVGLVEVSASNIPLHLLRNFLPPPLHQESAQLNGLTQLNFTLSPLNAWATTGQVNVFNLEIHAKTQVFKANKLHLDILEADMNGVQRATMTGNDWMMQFPLTPMQAWSAESHLDLWASMPWQFQSVELSQGTMTIGSDQKTWLKNTHLSIKNWQNTSPALMTLDAQFGLSPLHAKLHLQPNENNIMQWQTFDLTLNDANMFSLQDWLQYSNLPHLEKGHLSLDMHLSRQEKSKGNMLISLNYLQFIAAPTQNDFLFQQTGQSAQSVFDHIAKKQHLRVELELEEAPNQDLGQWVGQSLLNDISKRLNITNSNFSKHTPRSKNLGSFRIHQGNGLSQNERSRLRKIILNAKQQRGTIELVPDLAAEELSDGLKLNVFTTQNMLKSFMLERGIKRKNVYLIAAQDKHHSTNSTGAIHIRLVK